MKLGGSKFHEFCPMDARIRKLGVPPNRSTTGARISLKTRNIEKGPFAMRGQGKMFKKINKLTRKVTLNHALEPTMFMKTQVVSRNSARRHNGMLLGGSRLAETVP